MPATEEAKTVSFAGVLREDLSELHRAVTDWHVDEIPIYANRFTTDAGLFGEGDTREAALFIGGALRVATQDIIQAGARLATLKVDNGDLIDTSLTFLQSLAESLPELETEFVRLCRAYYKFELDVTRFQRMSAEASADAVSGPLEPPAWKVLGAVILRNASHLTEPRSLLADGIANELSRLSRVFLFESKDLSLFTALHSYGLLSQYYRFALMVPSEQLSDSAVADYRTEYSSYAKMLIGFVNDLSRAETDGSEWKLARSFVAPVVWRWREFFMLYMQLTQPGMIIGAPAQPIPSGATAPKKGKGTRERR